MTTSGPRASLIELIQTLNPDEQAAVQAFIKFLREEREQPTSPRAAFDEFVAEHSDLLQRLAQ
ncbi:MAG: hypothetical protein JO061_16290 [Acidobacteriaceae bacterium]|jgi:hypothetical protein|nr:hypothetical protein [Acidobacteriaceae bacterium]